MKIFGLEIKVERKPHEHTKGEYTGDGVWKCTDCGFYIVIHKGELEILTPELLDKL